ncbi:MAG: hypothetical protein LBP61_03305 [Desulfovibrio sp.]|jgi:hypothetical protein|nr:hypothetical protein [Desulfovibrio sp.]
MDAAFPQLRNDLPPQETLALLGHIRADAGFSRLAPRLRTVLEQRDSSGDTILEALSDNLCRLQDLFMEALYALFRLHGINTDRKVTLRLDNEALAPAGEHPDRERIAAALAISPDLSAVFADLASQSAVMRDLSSLRSRIHNSLHSDPRAAFPLLPGDPAYQLSLKGDMSHFYFLHA